MPDTPQLLAGSEPLLDDVQVKDPTVQLGQHPVEHMGFAEGLYEGAKNEWLIPSLMSGVDDDLYAPDPEWSNPVLSDPTIPLGYRDNFTRARNQEHYDSIKAQLEEEMKGHQKLQAATGWGTTGYMISAFLDPSLLAMLPVEELALGSKVAQLGKITKVLATGATMAASNSLVEAGVGLKKETRGIEDVVLAGGTGFLFGAGVGHVSSVLGKSRSIRKEVERNVARILDEGDASLYPNAIEKAVPASDAHTGAVQDISALAKSGPTDKPDAATFRGNLKFMKEVAQRSAANVKRGGAKLYELAVGERLRANRNGVVSAIADRLLENPSGTGGKRVSYATADIRNSLHQNMIASTYADYDNLYKQWYTDMGYSWRSARIAGQGREEFGEAVLRELDARRAGIPTDSHPIVKRVADEVSTKYNKVSLDIQKRAGVLNAEKVDHDPFYYPRQWDYEKMFRAGREKVVELISRGVKGAYLNMPEADAKKIAGAFWRRFHDKYTSNTGANSHMFNADTRDTFQDYLLEILDEDTVQEIMSKVTPVRGIEKAPGQLHRKLDLDMSAALDDGTTIYNLIETDYGMLLSRQSRDVSGRSALAEIGIKSDQDWDQLIRLAREQIGEDPKLKKDTDAGIRDLETAKRRLLGQSTVLNPNSKLARTARDLRDITHLSRMGQMGLAQMTELSNLVAEQGISNIVKAIPQMRRLKKMLRDGTMPKELSEDLSALGWRVGDEHLMNIPYYRADDGGLKATSYGETPGSARWRNSLQEGKRLLGYVSLQNSVMRQEQKLWLHSTLVRFYEDATGGPKLRTPRLRDMGFDDSMIARIREQITAHGGKFEDQGIVSLGFDKWDAEVLDAFRTGLTRQNGQAIQQNMVGDMPAWAMSSSFGQLLAQFRSFPMVAWSKQLRRQARYMDGVSFGTVAYGVPICAAVHMAKTNLNAIGMGANERKKYVDTQLSDKGLALGVVRYLPIASLMPDAAAATAPLLGLDFSSPYRAGTARAAEMSIGSLSPSLGYVNDAVKGVSALTNPKKQFNAKDARRLLNLLPFANTLLGRNITNGISSAFGEE